MFRYYGEKENLLDWLKVQPNFVFYFNPNIKDLSKIMTSVMQEQETAVFSSEENIIKRLLDKNIAILSEKKYTSFNLLDKKTLMGFISKFLNLDLKPNIEKELIELSKSNSLFDVCFIYKHTEDISLIKKSVKSTDINSIEFFRTSLRKLDYWNNFNYQDLFGKYSANKKDFFRDVLYRLEYSFKTSGLNGLPIYFQLLTNNLNHK